MTFQIDKPFPNILTIINGDKQHIYKMATDDNIRAIELENEYMMIQKMSTISDIFKTFDKYVDCNISNSQIEFPFYNSTLQISKYKISDEFETIYKNSFNMMYGQLDPNWYTFYVYCRRHKNMFIETVVDILDKVETVFRPNNFIHGDFKGNNIMIDIGNNGNKIKIIDLDFSLIFDSQTTININNADNLISLYLGPCTVTKEYLFLFDIWILASSIISCPKFFPSDMHKLIEKYYNNKESIITETFMDFFVIYNILHEYGYKFRNTKRLEIDGRFKTINQYLLRKPSTIYDERYSNHVLKIQNIILQHDTTILGKRNIDIAE